ncbi:MAG TPA: hypothetical protein VGP47_07155 [Parachlamydiaceae bacterium]|nr:hypothetical protein [Parachlamydiaceae bacterium]
MTKFSPEYQGLPVGWVPPACLPSETKFTIPDDVKKTVQSVVKDKLYIPESTVDKNLSQRATVLSSGVGGVVALAISQMINPGFGIGNIGLLGIGMLLGCKVGHSFFNYEVLTTVDIEAMIGEALTNPLFSFIHQKVNEEVPLGILLENGGSHSSNHSFAHYSFLMHEKKLVEHAIVICNKLSPEAAFTALLYEYANAYQRERMDALFQAAKEGNLGKEDFAISIELIELHTQLLTEQIVYYGKRYLNWQIKDPGMMQKLSEESIKRNVSMLDIQWWLGNYKESDSEISHADNYRLQWEEFKLEREKLLTVPITS